MTYEVAETYSRSWVGKLVHFIREQYALDVLREQIKSERKTLAGLSDEQLRDIGVTRSQANQEALRGYGDIPDSRRPFLICGC